MLNKSNGKARGKIEFVSRVPPLTRHVTLRFRDRERAYLSSVCAYAKLCGIWVFLAVTSI